MLRHGPWFDREFTYGLSPERLPGIIERLRGTPARLEELVHACTPEVLTHRQQSAWSIQENIGHLLDLEPLWHTRIKELRSGARGLAAADLQNRKTHEARHNDRNVKDILAEFRAARMAMVHHLEALSEQDARRSAFHPRLKQPMNAVDLAFFVAEHDDHHMATISRLLRMYRS